MSLEKSNYVRYEKILSREVRKLALKDLLFALDIGTRTVVGLVMESTDEGLKIVASEVLEHENRAMLDGQIHNVMEVARVVRTIKARLEEKIEKTLDKVAVAAAGRALQTTKIIHSIELDSKQEITHDDVNRLELAAIQLAQKNLAQNTTYNPADYHFVGYSVVAYRLDEMHISNLVGQKGTRIELELIATFLPRIVVDSLITVIQHADLTVQHMTLEPIAASTVVIPKEMHNFNLALVDIGAGTSDIAITKGGAIIAYAMVPVAGDEITEALAEHYLLDYANSENLKRSLLTTEKIEVTDILGTTLKIDSQETIVILKNSVEEITNLIAEEILTLNQKPPQAVLCIGGGSLTPLLTQELANKLNLPANRVGIKKATDIKGVIGEIPNLSSTQTITPIGIAVSAWQNTSQTTFLDVKVNDQRISIFSLSTPTVSDALLAANLPINQFYGRLGLAITCTVNGKLRTIKGTIGQPGKLELNGQKVKLDTPIQDSDQIIFTPGTDGKNGSALIKDFIHFDQPKKISLNGTPVEIKTIVTMNGKPVLPETEIIDRAKINYFTAATYREALVLLLEIPANDLISREIQITLNNRPITLHLGKYKILINGEIKDLDLPLLAGDEIDVQQLNNEELLIKDLISYLDENFELKITFNNRELLIPTNHWEILQNGDHVVIETKINDGDEIIFKAKPIPFNKVLSFINYQIPQSLSGKLQMTINGEEAQLTDPVKTGDKIDINMVN